MKIQNINNINLNLIRENIDFEKTKKYNEN